MRSELSRLVIEPKKVFFIFTFQNITHSDNCLLNSGLSVAQMVEALRYRPKCRGFDSLWRHWIFQFASFFQPCYGPGLNSAFNRNAYQKYFWGEGVKGRPASKVANSLPSVRKLSRKCGRLDESQPYGPPRPVTGISLLLPYLHKSLIMNSVTLPGLKQNRSHF
jgi:hypothetical protein